MGKKSDDLTKKSQHFGEQAKKARQAGDNFLADANQREAIRLNDEARKARNENKR